MIDMYIWSWPKRYWLASARNGFCICWVIFQTNKRWSVLLISFMRHFFRFLAIFWEERGDIFKQFHRVFCIQFWMGWSQCRVIGKSDQFDGAVTFNVAQNDPVGKYLFEIDSSGVMMESSNSSVFRQVLFDEIQKIESFYLETLKKVEETFIYLNKQTVLA